MIKKVWLLLIALAFAAGCATEPEKPEPKPAPPPPPAPKPAPPPEPVPAPKPKPAPEKPKPVAEKVTFAADVLFDFDKADIRPDAAKVLAEAADVVRSHGTRRVVIEGHTDARGTAQYNQRLSERRAQAVKRWFQERGGLKTAALETRGLGAKKPVAPNAKPDGSDDPEGRQKNRRVEIVIAKQTR
jgi:outer membrane protein OmpA-like peptidoglycan-associated protein